MPKILTSDAVDELFKKCAGDDLVADGIVHKFSFSREQIEKHKPEIKALLAELPEPFMANKGGGWSFLNGCIDRQGDQWTGLHLTVEQLVCLGIAAGAAKWTMKEMASMMPGGMPYFVVL